MVSQEHSDPISSESEIDPSHAVRQFSFRDVSWSWSEVLIGIAPIVLSRLIPLLIDVRSLAAAPRWLWISLNVPVISWMLLYPLWIVRRRVGLLRAPSFRTVLVEGLCTLPVLGLVVIVMNLGYDMMVTLAGESYAPSDPLDSYVRSPSLLLSRAFMILAVFVVPIAEEVCFRGMVYSALRQRIRLFPAALLQAIVFGFLHPFDLVHSVLLVGLGFILAILYEWRKTLVAPIILHSLVNVLAIAAITLGLTPSANAPALGVGGEPVDGGCKVTVLGPGSAADEAGIRVGDRITALDGESVSDFRSLARLVLRRNVGDKVTIAFVRDGESQQVEAVLKRRRDSGS